MRRSYHEGTKTHEEIQNRTRNPGSPVLTQRQHDSHPRETELLQFPVIEAPWWIEFGFISTSSCSSCLRGEISAFLPGARKKMTPDSVLSSQTADQVRPSFSTQAFSVICSKPWPLHPFLPLHPLMDVLHSLLPLQALAP